MTNHRMIVKWQKLPPVSLPELVTLELFRRQVEPLADDTVVDVVWNESPTG